MKDLQTKNSQAVEACTELCKKIIIGTVEISGLYFGLVELCRKNRKEEAELRTAMIATGLSKPRVSEITRVADLPDDVYSEYAARNIGFKKALEFARVHDDRVIELFTAKALLEAGGPSVVNEAIADVPEEKQNKSSASAGVRLDKAMAAVFRLLDGYRGKRKVWTSGTGLVLTLSKDIDQGGE